MTADSTSRKRDKHMTDNPGAALVDRIAGIVMSVFVDALVLLVLVALAWTVWLVGVDLYQGVIGAADYEVKNLFVEMLTIFIFIEIFHSLVEYLRDQRISITSLADVSLAIIFRELWIGLFGFQLSWQMVVAFAVVIVAIGAVRVVISREQRQAVSADTTEIRGHRSGSADPG